MVALSTYVTGVRSITMLRLPPATSVVTADEKSARIGYISLGSPTRTMETPPVWSVVRFINALHLLDVVQSD